MRITTVLWRFVIQYDTAKMPFPRVILERERETLCVYLGRNP